MYRKWIILIVILALGIVPALAQNTSTNSVSFNGVSFNFDPALATNVSITQYPGDPPEFGAGGADAPHIQFIVDNQYPIRASIFDAGGIRVYNTADFANYEWLTTQLQQIQTLLNDRPDLAQFMASAENANVNALPFVPVLAAGQVIRARAQYVETAAVRGISYITAYKQDVSPLLSGDFIYTFQGASTDGTRYVSVIFKLNASAFPVDDPADFNLETFQAQLQTYLTESIAALNAGTPTDFMPSLASLDALVQSITFTPVSGGTGSEIVPTPTPVGDPTLRGLAGKTWTLVSYGSADAPVAVLPETPVTAVFAESGVSGNASCNSYSGPFQYDNETLTFGQIISTLIACSEPIVAQETAYLTALTSATSYVITDQQLQIFYDGGVLTFTAT